jgi:hypothetical protein
MHYNEKKIDLEKAAEVKKPEIKSRSSTSDLTFDSYTYSLKENEVFSTFDEILHHFEQIDNL